MRQYGFSQFAIDRLTAINPARYAAQFLVEQFDYPIATMVSGAMANLCVFDPEVPYRVDETALRVQLQDPHYWSAYRGERLFGQVLFTVVNGRVWDVLETPTPLN